MRVLLRAEPPEALFFQDSRKIKHEAQGLAEGQRTNPLPEVQLEGRVVGGGVVRVRRRAAADVKRDANRADAARAVTVTDGALIQLAAAQCWEKID